MEIKIEDKYNDFNFDPNERSDVDELDAKFAKSQKEHRNFLDSLDYRFKVVTHPLTLCLFLAFVSILFCIARYIAVGKGTPVAVTMAADMKSFLSYIATFVFSSMFTWFLENHGKNLSPPPN